MIKYNRTIDIAAVSSGMDADSLEFNLKSGAKKILPIGPHLIPIPVVVAGSPTWKTDVSTLTALPTLGLNLAVYNNSSTVKSITIGNTSSLASLAVGAVDANGNVGVACPPNSYTNLSMGVNQWIISSDNTLIVYLVEDDTRITAESR